MSVLSAHSVFIDSGHELLNIYIQTLSLYDIIILTNTFICNVLPPPIFIAPDSYIYPIHECESFNAGVDGIVTLQCVIVEWHVTIPNLSRGVTVSCNSIADDKKHIYIYIYIKLIQMRTQQFVRCHPDSNSRPPVSDTETIS